MQNAIAFSNNDVITIAWSFDKKPVGCMGFAVYRIDADGTREALPNQIGFTAQALVAGQKSDKSPIQKFYWKDVFARLIAEKTGKRKFRYEIVPLEGTPGHLKPMPDFPILTSNEVEISSKTEDNLEVYFNRGLISTQKIAKELKRNADKGRIQDLITFEAHNPIRESLSGDMVEALTGFIHKAKTSGSIYAALYELGDAELIANLKGLKKKLFIILSDSKGKIDDTSREKHVNTKGELVYYQKTIDHNDPAREELKGSNIWHRVMPEGHIGHNKFLIYVDASGKPQSVLLGSTNWTPTGLCTQTNNTIIIEDESLAARYMEYWEALKVDTEAAGGNAKKLQGTVLRTYDHQGKSLTDIENIPLLESWFSPNTPKARSSKTANELRPADMESVAKYIDGAQHAILFLAFYPGSPSIANWSALALKKNKNLFVRGCVTNKSASEGFYYDLKGITPPPKVAGQPTQPTQDYRVIGAEAFDNAIPEGWQKELLSAGFAIIHDKIMVIDPFSDDCVVVTGSHNLGHKASYDNDENLVIIKGNKKIALAYTTHVLDVYDHFSARYWFKKLGSTGHHLESDPEKWLAKYYNTKGEIINAQLKFWLQV